MPPDGTRHAGFGSLHCGPVEAAVRRNDWCWVAGWVSGRFDVRVDSVWAHDRWRNRGPGRRSCGGNWSDGSWAMFWKAQLIKDGFFAHEAAGVETFRLTTEMHCFFISLEETPEMLERLRRVRNENDDGTKQRGTATPAIERILTSPEPIDATAARVVGHNPEPKR